jgi:hypothetical protein
LCQVIPPENFMGRTKRDPSRSPQSPRTNSYAAIEFPSGETTISPIQTFRESSLEASMA